MFIQEKRYARKHIRTPASPAGACPCAWPVVLTVSLCVPALAANGDQENGGVVGVASDAQIFSMQVFGCI